MSVFSAYSEVYDALYHGKDYEGEADWVLQRLRAQGPKPASLLELGSGTGKHAVFWAGQGVQVEGIDQSPEMVAHANERAAASEEVAGRVTFEVGDVRSVPPGPPVDAVVSLFHVWSYQTANEDALAMARGAAS
ncbi:MAG: class I SAM-dependent methyltransferase, partial [Myxococcales bacterium]|nr:class I SAM-dependent methyltransferase [Myxococcales bacterium]